MRLHLNGKDHDAADGTSAGQLVDDLKIPRQRVAVVVNENVVRRANLDETPLADGDTVEIITMVGGG